MLAFNVLSCYCTYIVEIIRECIRWKTQDIAQCRFNVINAMYPALTYFVLKPWRLKGVFQFEIVLNDLVSSFRFISIPMLWICGH